MAHAELARPLKLTVEGHPRRQPGDIHDTTNIVNYLRGHAGYTDHGQPAAYRGRVIEVKLALKAATRVPLPPAYSGWVLRLGQARGHDLVPYTGDLYDFCFEWLEDFGSVADFAWLDCHQRLDRAGSREEIATLVERCARRAEHFCREWEQGRGAEETLEAAVGLAGCFTRFLGRDCKHSRAKTLATHWECPTCGLREVS
jgi:hypothetical protein